MGKNTSALDSRYIIDGLRMDATPRQILAALGAEEGSCSVKGGRIGDDLAFEDIIDESADPSPVYERPSQEEVSQFLSSAAPHGRSSFPLSYCGSLSRLAVASAVLDLLMRNGTFRIGDLGVSAAWEWDEGRIGAMASFYESVSAAAGYIEDLGLELESFSYRSSDRIRLGVEARIAPARGKADENIIIEKPFSAQNPVLAPGFRCPGKAVGDKDNWLIYIPFDTCGYRLGGSLLSQELGFQGGKSPDLGDADYFIDCFEVVRELVEDGIVLSGLPVAEGGLMKALRQLCEGRSLCADISGIMNSAAEDDPVKVLFGEIPGALVEIKSPDFDYVDVELLLQDVAYYPLGRFDGSEGELKINTAPGAGLQGILQALLGEASEGED